MRPINFKAIEQHHKKYVALLSWAAALGRGRGPHAPVLRIWEKADQRAAALTVLVAGTVSGGASELVRAAMGRPPSPEPLGYGSISRKNRTKHPQAAFLFGACIAAGQVTAAATLIGPRGARSLLAGRQLQAAFSSERVALAVGLIYGLMQIQATKKLVLNTYRVATGQFAVHASTNPIAFTDVP